MRQRRAWDQLPARPGGAPDWRRGRRIPDVRRCGTHTDLLMPRERRRAGPGQAL